MSWINFNDSLNNLKGQLSNLASGVLTDPSNNSSDLSSNEKKYEDLEQLIANQADEIVALRKENAEIYEKCGISKNGDTQNDKWSWDPPDTSQRKQQDFSPVIGPDIIENFKKYIRELENEKRDLNASLEQLDLDCQQTTEKLITLKDSLQSECNDWKTKHELLLEEYETLQKDNIQKAKAVQQLQTEKGHLSKLLKEARKSKEADNNNDSLKSRIEALEEENSKLKREKVEILSNNSSNNSTNEENHQEKEVEVILLLKQIEELNGRIKDYQNSHIAERAEYEKLATILQGYDEQVKNYKSQCQLLQSENEKLLERENSIVLELSSLKGTLDKNKDNILTSSKEIQDQCLNLLTDSFKKFMDYPLPVELNNQDTSFISVVETVMKILLDLKWKTETLKKEVDDMTEEKTRILTEKNHEINKLLENSEILSQEVITKTQALKNYEEENSELIKNNDDLINQLEMYKFNTRGLHTISESNEDNLVILETQLEKSNKEIKELEMTITDLENSKQEVTVEVQTELDYIKKQLNITGTELSQTKREYEELMEKHMELQFEHANLRKSFDEMSSSYDDCYTENKSLNTTVDKIQTEIENTEYKYVEMNISMETLKEETDILKAQIDSLTESNKKLTLENSNSESKNELIQNEVEDLKQQLTAEIDLREQQEIQFRSLSEKLQNAKMSETYFKLQNDTLHKDLNTLAEEKQSLTSKFDKLMENYKTTENYLKIYEEENIKLIEQCQEMDKIREYSRGLESNMGKLEDLLNTNAELVNKLKVSEVEILRLQEENENIKVNTVSLDLQEYENKISALEKENIELKKQLNILNQKFLDLSNEKQDILEKLQAANNISTENVSVIKEYTEKIEHLERCVEELTNSRNEMVNFVNTKHQESIQYHNEIQRLNQVLLLETKKSQELEVELKKIEETKSNETKTDDNILQFENEIAKMKEGMEKLTDQNEFLRKKSEVLAQNLLEEQSKVQQVLAEKNNAITEKEAGLSKELQRLRAHLMESEEAHTQEMVLAEKRIQEMQSKVNEIEHREKESSTLYTSVNIRANQHVETLQNQLHMVTNQRDDLRKKISDSEDQISKQTAALSNLQFVLEQFQKDKEKDVYHETERIRRQINIEKQRQEELQKEIVSLRNQLEESKQGLLAASRLSHQMESSKQQVTKLKDEVTKLEGKLKKSEERYSTLTNQTDSKVDKMLVKNLIVGFISSNNNLNKDQCQILKIIATVLDFNEDDNEKVKLNKPNQVSWLNSILHPQGSRGQEMNQESLSQAFVRFLENESKPRHLPNLLDTAPLDTARSSPNSSAELPILLSQVVLPTFADFGQNRNSSSILKDVLKDNN